MEAEIWKAVKGYEGLYEVSSLGRIKSLQKTVFKGRGAFYTLKEIILKSSFDANGYPHVGLCKNGTAKTIVVHQLVAMAFLNHTLNGHVLVVDHINGILTDNSVENLRIVTQRFNLTIGHRKDKGKTSSQYLGVHWNKRVKKWVSQIDIDGRKKYLGIYQNELDAHNAYQNELNKLILKL